MLSVVPKPQVLRCRTAQRQVVGISLAGGTLLIVMLGIIQLRRSAIPEPSYYFGLAFIGPIALALFLVAALATRSYTLRLWQDRLTYHHIAGTLTVARRDIASVGYDVRPFPSNRPLAMLAVKRYLQPRLYLRLRDDNVIWLDQFWVPPASSTTRFAEHAHYQQGQILECLNKWITDG